MSVAVRPHNLEWAFRRRCSTVDTSTRGVDRRNLLRRLARRQTLSPNQGRWKHRAAADRNVIRRRCRAEFVSRAEAPRAHAPRSPIHQRRGRTGGRAARQRHPSCCTQRGALPSPERIGGDTTAVKRSACTMRRRARATQWWRGGPAREACPAGPAVFLAGLIWIVAVPMAHGVAPWAISLLSLRRGWERGGPGIANLVAVIPIAIGSPASPGPWSPLAFRRMSRPDGTAAARISDDARPVSVFAKSDVCQRAGAGSDGRRSTEASAC